MRPPTIQGTALCATLPSVMPNPTTQVRRSHDGSENFITALPAPDLRGPSCDPTRGCRVEARSELAPHTEREAAADQGVTQRIAGLDGVDTVARIGEVGRVGDYGEIVVERVGNRAVELPIGSVVLRIAKDVRGEQHVPVAVAVSQARIEVAPLVEQGSVETAPGDALERQLLAGVHTGGVARRAGGERGVHHITDTDRPDLLVAELSALDFRLTL